MKKRVIAVFLACMLAVPVLGGCSRTDREAQESYRKQGIQKMQEGDYASAEEAFQKALDEAKGKTGDIEKDISYYKALAQFKNGDASEAIKTYDAMIQEDEKNADLYFLRGSAYLAQNEKSDGLKDYEKAISLDKENYQLYAQIYENLASYGYEAEGKEWLQEALKQDPKDADAYCGQGYLQYLLGENEKADKLLDTAVEKGSDDAMLYQARVKKALDDTKAAEKLLKDYAEKQKDDQEALEKAGKTALDVELYDTAVSIYEQAAKLDTEGKDTQLQLNLIYAYEYSGDFETAYNKMKAYVKEHADDETAQRELTFLETRVKTPASEENTTGNSQNAGADTNATVQNADATGQSANAIDGQVFN